MKCPECESSHIRKNGIKKGKQNHICVDCLRQFVIRNAAPRGYSDEFKRECLKMYLNGMGLRGIDGPPVGDIKETLPSCDNSP